MSTEPAILPGPAAPAPGASGAPSPVDRRHQARKSGTLGLAIGSVGVVYGDIGTSPLYALRESLAHAVEAGTMGRDQVIGIVSLIIWALTIVVSLKYVILIMRADNKGEGGSLSLMALAQSGLARGGAIVTALGVIGAALFYGDAIITPAISVLSALEGLKLVAPGLSAYILPIAIAVLAGLFLAQSRGTGSVATFFGPIMLAWFAMLAGLGVIHIADDWGILAAFDPRRGAVYLASHGYVALLVAGSVFLAVTGAEALTADMGHFGRRPIRLAWTFVVFPALVLNYLGQGALILSNPAAASNPFFLLAPDWFLLPMVILATLATIIASQAVITGAYSLTQQAIQLGLIPRLEIRHTSETQAGQIYLPQVTRLLFVGVIVLVLLFRSSSALASAYGIAVTGTMVVTTLLAMIVFRRVFGWSAGLVALVFGPLLLVDIGFLSANLIKVLDGGWVPLLFGAFLMVVMWTWVRGSAIVASKSRRESVPMADLLRMLEKSKPQRVRGTAVFLTSDPDTSPGALLHNLKHNKVLHQRNIMLTVRVADAPRVPEAEQLRCEEVSADVKRLIATIGYMQTPRVPHFLTMARRHGMEFDIMQTSFFLGRRTIKASARSGMPLWQDELFIALARSATSATDFFHIPSGRVVELGSQVTV